MSKEVKPFRAKWGEMMKKLYRSSQKKIAGICGGLGELFGADLNLFRLGLILLALVNVILPVLATSVIRR